MLHWLVSSHMGTELQFCMCAKSFQSCLTLCDLLDCIPPGSSVQEILQAEILEWIAMPSSRESSWSRDWAQVSCISGRFLTVWATGKPGFQVYLPAKPLHLAQLQLVSWDVLHKQMGPLSVGPVRSAHLAVVLISRQSCTCRSLHEAVKTSHRSQKPHRAWQQVFMQILCCTLQIKQTFY